MSTTAREFPITAYCHYCDAEQEVALNESARIVPKLEDTPEICFRLVFGGYVRCTECHRVVFSTVGDVDLGREMGSEIDLATALDQIKRLVNEEDDSEIIRDIREIIYRVPETRN